MVMSVRHSRQIYMTQYAGRGRKPADSAVGGYLKFCEGVPFLEGTAVEHIAFFSLK